MLFFGQMVNQPTEVLMTAKKATARQQRLDRKIATRLAFLKKVTDFAESITCERGKLLQRSVGSSHTHTIRELQGFGSFSFLADTGQSMMGGNRVKVWYHPDCQYKEGLIPVLEVWWQVSIEECDLQKFDPDKKWQSKILQVIRRRKEISAQVDRATVASKKRSREEQEERMRQQGLQNKAKRLHIL